MPHPLLRRALLRIASALTAATLALPASAGPYPDKPVRLVVPFPAGGATDFMARSLGQKLAERLGQAIF